MIFITLHPIGIFDPGRQQLIDVSCKNGKFGGDVDVILGVVVRVEDIQRVSHVAVGWKRVVKDDRAVRAIVPDDPA